MFSNGEAKWSGEFLGHPQQPDINSAVSTLNLSGNERANDSELDRNRLLKPVEVQAYNNLWMTGTQCFMSVPRIVYFESSERLTGKLENVMRSMSWVLTHSLLGILLKKAPGYRKLQVTKRPFTVRTMAF